MTLTFKLPWSYLTAAIVQSIAILVGLTIELLDMSFLLTNIVMVALGYFAYYQIHKLYPKGSKEPQKHKEEDSHG